MRLNAFYSVADLGVQCEFLAQPTSTIAQVLADASENVVYHIKAKIVDHTPMNDWVQWICPECFESFVFFSPPHSTSIVAQLERKSYDDEVADHPSFRIPFTHLTCFVHQKSLLVYRIQLRLIDEGNSGGASSNSISLIIDEDDFVGLRILIIRFGR